MVHFILADSLEWESKSLGSGEKGVLKGSGLRKEKEGWKEDGMILEAGADPEPGVPVLGDALGPQLYLQAPWLVVVGNSKKHQRKN